MTPTPEPGQRYILEAECVPSTAGHPMLTPITADGQPSAIRLAPTRYRWQPVPPQPPVLDGRSVVFLAGDDKPWEVYRWWPGPQPTLSNEPPMFVGLVRPASHWQSPGEANLAAFEQIARTVNSTKTEGSSVGQCGNVLPPLFAGSSPISCHLAYGHVGTHSDGSATWTAAAPLADVPGPDDSTPEPPRCDGCDGAGVIQTADGWENCDHCVTEDEPQAAGEGAALIAATEQEIAERFSEEPRPLSRAAYAAKADAWEATARRLAEKVDELWLPQRWVTGMTGGDDPDARAPVQATTHGEAPAVVTWKQATDVVQETFNAIEARRAALAECEAGEAQTGVQGAARPANLGWAAPTEVRWDPKPAVQGAGRDLAGEIAKEMAEYAETRIGQTVVYAEMAAHLVAALGLHDLEQAADENLRELNELHLAIDAASGNDGSETNVEAIERLGRECARAIDSEIDRTDERDAARRELEQLRGEVEAVAHKLAAFSSCYFGCHKAAHANAEYLRSLAAATAPATQDGADHGKA